MAYAAASPLSAQQLHEAQSSPSSESSATATASATSVPASPASSEPHLRKGSGLPSMPVPASSSQLPLPESDASGRHSSTSSTRSGSGAGLAPLPIRPGSGRHRSSSLLTVERVHDSHDVMLDQNAGYNANADWVNHKGAWVVHIVLILTGKILVDVIPGITQDLSWTIVNLTYMALTFLMFHHVTGTPFDANAGAYDELTLWEQIDEGAQHTPAKKWLTSVPIGLFLISTHYTRYNLWLFTLNFTATLIVLFPKLPILHRLRFKVLPAHFSGPPTPNISRAPTPISRTGTPMSAYGSGRKSPRAF